MVFNMIRGALEQGLVEEPLSICNAYQQVCTLILSVRAASPNHARFKLSIIMFQSNTSAQPFALLDWRPTKTQHRILKTSSIAHANCLLNLTRRISNSVPMTNPSLFVAMDKMALESSMTSLRRYARRDPCLLQLHGKYPWTRTLLVVTMVFGEEYAIV